MDASLWTSRNEVLQPFLDGTERSWHVRLDGTERSWHVHANYPGIVCMFDRQSMVDIRKHQLLVHCMFVSKAVTTINTFIEWQTDASLWTSRNETLQPFLDRAERSWHARVY